MILLPGLLFVLWGEPARCLGDDGGVTFDGDIRDFAVATNTVYVATEGRLYQLNHDLTPVRSVAQRGILTGLYRTNDERFSRVAFERDSNATFSVNMLLPLVDDDALISCGVIKCGYCELLELKDISKVRYSEHIQVGSLWSKSSSVGFLVDVNQTGTETYILTGIKPDPSEKLSCPSALGAVNLQNTNDKQRGNIFSNAGPSSTDSIQSKDKDDVVEFVDGFQIGIIIYLFSNVRSSGQSNKVRLLWLEGAVGKKETFRSLQGSTLRVSGEGRRLLASAVIPGGPPVLWSGVFSAGAGQTDTELVLFDISPDLTGHADKDPDFCSVCTGNNEPPKTLEPKAVLFTQNYMTSVLAVRQKAWMVFFIGTGDGQLIKLAMDHNFHTTCPRVLYRANDDRQVFPKMRLDQVDLKHVYMPFQNQMKRVPVSTCSTHTNVQDCWSAQDPFCVWCSSEKSCTFEDECQDSDWISIPDDSQKKMVSYTVVTDSTGQITLNVQAHVTAGKEAQSIFACHFSVSSRELCSRESPPPQFPQCTCILSNRALPAEGLHVTVRFRFGATQQLKLSNCSDIRGPPTPVTCRQCIEAGCGWNKTRCSWANEGVVYDDVCKTMESGMNLFRPEISSITPSVVSFYGRNHAVLLGFNLSDVTGVRIQADKGCTPIESPVWNNTGVSLTFHIASAKKKGTVRVCVLLPDDSCHGNATITYQSSPSCSNITPSSTWVSGKRTITLTGSHLKFVEGVVHDHAQLDIRPPSSRTFWTLWKNIKLDLKKRNAEARRERFSTGGGPPPSKDKPDEVADLLTGITEDQQPLDCIPDDDHLDSGHEELGTHEEIILTLVEEPVHSDCAPSTSGVASQRKDAAAAATTFQQRPKRMSMLEKLALEFHEQGMKYLKEEHDMKMRILQVELCMKLEERAVQRKVHERM